MTGVAVLTREFVRSCGMNDTDAEPPGGSGPGK
jgi:hypothetical protein